MNAPLLTFYSVFDTELKLSIVETLLNVDYLSLEELHALVGGSKHVLLVNIWELQNHRIIYRIVQNNKNYYELSNIGRSFKIIEQEIEIWENCF